MTSSSHPSHLDATANARGDLRMTPQEMLALARETAELLVLRMCILNHTTTWNDVRETLETVERFGSEAFT